MRVKEMSLRLASELRGLWKCINKKKTKKLCVLIAMAFAFSSISPVFGMNPIAEAKRGTIQMTQQTPQQRTQRSTSNNARVEQEEPDYEPEPVYDPAPEPLPPPPEYTPPAIQIAPLPAYTVESKASREALLEAVNQNCQKILEFKDVFEKERQDIKARFNEDIHIAQRVTALSEQLNSPVYLVCGNFQKLLRRQEATPAAALEVLETIQDNRYGAPWDGYIHSKETVDAEIGALAKIVVEDKKKQESAASFPSLPTLLIVVVSVAVGFFAAKGMKKS